MNAVAARAQLVVDMTAQCLRIGAATLVADSCGVAYWPAQETLLVADLHLEKGAHFAGRGSFLPPYDTCETLARLADAVARYAPRHVVALGDSFHSTRGAADISGDDLDTLLGLQAGRKWTWITGNHDRRCFVSDGQRVVMPAFGAFTGGLDILDAAFTPIFPQAQSLAILMLGDSGLYPVPRHLLTAAVMRW